MSIDFGKMLGSVNPITQTQKVLRAHIQQSRLADKPTVVSFFRNGNKLAPQSVRLEFDDTHPSSSFSDTGLGFTSRGVLFGFKDHDTEPDLDVDVWDTFVLNEQEYTITRVNKSLIGQIQCSFEAVGS